MFEALISFLIFALVVCFVAFIVVWILQECIAMLPSSPPNLGRIIRLIVALVALLIIVRAAIPLIHSFT